MATSHSVEFDARRTARSTATRTAHISARDSAYHRVVSFFTTIVAVFREARELEIRMLGDDRFRRIGEA
ncbi:MAG: hypothetical protein IT522_06340 [Burkholderiales bacterium]|nr:hypothetical protein [Burkholderiales bacterium]